MTEQLTLDRYAKPEFGGDYDEADAPKMRSNLARVECFLVARPGEWFSKEEIRIGAGLPIGTEIRARCNDLRALYTIECEKIEGVYRYRLTTRETEKENAT